MPLEFERMVMDIKKQLIEKLKRKKAVIGIVGLGYVGLPLMIRYSEVGFRVLGIDIDVEKVKKLNHGESYIEHIRSEAIKTALSQGFEATADFARSAEVDALIICVPTPLTRHREPDISFIVGTMQSLQPHLRAGQVVSLESTSYPGTTDEELKPRIEARGFTIGQDVFLVFSPEREDPANPKYRTQTIPKICGGCTPDCLEVGMALYGQVIDRMVPVSSTRAAEMTKLLENIHRAVNIGLVNELKILTDKMKLDIHEIIRAAATKPFGFVPYYPGPGLGGHCIPVDPFYLTWKAREYGFHTRFIELAGEVNNAMPEWVVGKVSEALNDRRKALRGANVLVLGVAYKKNVDDMRESPAVEIMEILRKKGAKIAYSDPHVPVFPKQRLHRFEMKSTPLTPESMASFDCVIVAADHDLFDYELIKKHAALIVDTRGIYQESADNIVKA